MSKKKGFFKKGSNVFINGIKNVGKTIGRGLKKGADKILGVFENAENEINKGVKDSALADGTVGISGSVGAIDTPIYIIDIQTVHTRWGLA